MQVVTYEELNLSVRRFGQERKGCIKEVDKIVVECEEMRQVVDMNNYTCLYAFTLTRLCREPF